MIDHQHESAAPTNRLMVLVAGHRLGVLIILTIGIALAFSAIGLSLYHASGTAQLDLTRPDYEGVSETIGQDGEAPDFIDYPANGPIDEAALKEFDRLYTAQLENIDLIDAFGGDPMSLESLRIDSEER